MRKQKISRKSAFEKTVIARISGKKYEELKGMLSRSRLKTMSELLRYILENRPVTLEYYDKTLDVLMLELAENRRVIQAVGVNINQVTKRFHGQVWPEAMMANAREIAELYQGVDLRIQKLFELMDKMAQKWLQE